MGRTSYKQRVRQDILKRHGLEPAKHGQLKPVVKRKASLAGVDLNPKPGKTLTMLLLEAQLGEPIEIILESGTLGTLSRETGLHRSTISKWRKQLGLR